MTMPNIKTWLSRFSRDEDGNITMEALIWLPMLFWAYLMMFAIFDAYRQHSINQKAAYTIADMISRQTTPLDNAFLNGTRDMLSYLTNVDTPDDTSVRITSVRWDDEDDRFELEWSHENNWGQTLTDADVSGMSDRLPEMVDNERITIVETGTLYDPPFNTGLAVHTITNFVFTAPRYAERILWSNN